MIKIRGFAAEIAIPHFRKTAGRTGSFPAEVLEVDEPEPIVPLIGSAGASVDATTRSRVERMTEEELLKGLEAWLRGRQPEEDE